MRILCGKLLKGIGRYEGEGTRGRVNVGMFECWNGGLEGLGGLESLEGKDVHPRVELLVRGKKSFGHVKTRR